MLKMLGLETAALAARTNGSLRPLLLGTAPGSLHALLHQPCVGEEEKPTPLAGEAFDTEVLR